MRECMVPDDMACRGYFANDVGSLLHAASNQKESRADIVPGQHFEQPQSMGIIRTVIIGQSKLPTASRQARECPAKPLAGRRHGLIASGECSRSRDASDRKGKHAGIVMLIADFVIAD